MPSLVSSFNPTIGPILQIGIAADDHSGRFILYDALLDTGASSTAISNKVVEELNLEVTGMRMVASASDVRPTSIYTATIVIPFEHTVLRVPDRQLGLFLAPDYFDILLGRDVLCQGHLSMAPDGHLTFSL